MINNLKFRYSFIAFLCISTVLTLEAPALKSNTGEKNTFFNEELEFFWKDDKPGMSVFLKRIDSRLPKYKTLFVEAASNIDVDWTLLAAISYQESHWDPKAISNTGVRGMMMLTQKTAKEMGIKKRTNPEESILGGAKYFQKTMNRLPNEIGKLDRIWLSLAAYNLGFKNIELARLKAESEGFNPNLWNDVSLSLEKILKDRYGKESHEFVKHKQVVEYVDRVNLFYTTLSIIKKSEELFLLAEK